MIVFKALFQAPLDTDDGPITPTFKDYVEELLLRGSNIPRFIAYQQALSYTHFQTMPATLGVACTDPSLADYRKHAKIETLEPDWYLDMMAFGIVPVLANAVVGTMPLICRCPWPERLIEHVERRIAERHPLYLNAKLKREYLAV